MKDIKRKYEIIFSNDLKCLIEIGDLNNNEINIIGAVDGWGHNVPDSEITIIEIKDHD